MRLFFWLAVFLVSALAGCGGGESETTTSAQGGSLPAASSSSVVPFGGQSYTLGQVDGTLADLLVESLVQNATFTTQTSEGPIVLSNDVLSQTSPEIVEALAKAYQDGRPILMMQPDAAQIIALRSVLGLEESFELPTNLPPGKQYAEAVAFDREEHGDSFVLELYPPNESEPDETEFFWEDGPEDQAARVEIILDWLREDQSRPSTLTDGSVQLSSRDLQGLAQAQVDSKVFTLRGAIYQITHFIYACHSFSDPGAVGSDWFFVQQSLMVNYSNGYAKTENVPTTGGQQATAGRYGGTLSTDSWLQDQDTGNGSVLLAVNKPENANNVVTVNSGVSYSFGGTVGFQGKDATGAVSGGVTISSSKAFNVTDCQVVNNSASRFTNAQWEYTFNKAEGIRYIFYAGLTDPPVLTRTNFQPVNQWIWRLLPAVRQNPANQGFRTKLRTVTIGSGGGTVDGPWVGKGPFHAEEDYDWDLHIPLRYPPVLVAPPTLNFGSQAGFQPMEFSASQNWSITSDQPWCTVSTSSGTPSLARTNVTCEQNATGQDRSAVLTITSPGNGGVTTVQIFQSRFPN